jgi:hypothetical protein
MPAAESGIGLFLCSAKVKLNLVDVYTTAAIDDRGSQNAVVNGIRAAF